MYIENGLFTSECVTPGHPDKVCDAVSDAILTECLKGDRHSRVACECLIGAETLHIMGEITTKANVDYEKVARDTISGLGYNSWETGFDAWMSNVIVDINTQSPDIAMGVDNDGAGDQGMVFGFASNETGYYLPLSYILAVKLCEQLDDLRNISGNDWLRPDGKSQVTVEYKNGKVVGIDTIVVSCQHRPDISIELVREKVLEKVIIPVIEREVPGIKVENIKHIYINPTGRFVIGGPTGDTGLTGRKIIVDTYGGHGRHGGGAFSGKDGTKVDRSGAYMARKVAKDIVVNKLADVCEVQVSYAIGVAKPVSICVNTYGTGRNISDANLAEFISNKYDFTPKGMIESLRLKTTDFNNVAALGHFTKAYLPWEKVTKYEKDELKDYIDIIDEHGWEGK